MKLLVKMLMFSFILFTTVLYSCDDSTSRELEEGIACTECPEPEAPPPGNDD